MDEVGTEGREMVSGEEMENKENERGRAHGKREKGKK